VPQKSSSATTKTTKLQNNNNNITHSGSKPIMLLIPFIQPLQKAKKGRVYIYRMRQYIRLDVVNTLDIISTGKLKAGDRNKY
jgi:hypothetical protein